MTAKKKRLLMFIAAAVIIASATVWYFNFSKFKIRENVSVECNYIRYACGDCYPRYNVTTVNPSVLTSKLKGKDIDIEFSSKEQEAAFKKQIGICDGCYKYSLRGDLFYSQKKDCYVLKIKKFKLVLWSKDCCIN